MKEELQETEYFLVGVKSNAAETSIQIYIDGVDGVGIGYCAKLSRRISATLDEMEFEAERYRYEISSPGADNPLVDIRQYPKHIGRELKLVLGEDQELIGKLLSVQDDQLTIEIVLDKKKKLTETKTIDFKNIMSSTVQISFKSVKR